MLHTPSSEQCEGSTPAKGSILIGTPPRKQADESAWEVIKQLRQLPDAIPALIWIARADGVVVFIHWQVQQYLGFCELGDGTWEWEEAVHPDDVQRGLAAWQRSAETGEPFQVEHRLRMADGQWRWHLCRGLPVRDEQGKITGWHGTSTDIQDLRDAQEELAATKIAAEAAREAAERASRAKDEFLAVLSHELRNPLNPVLATASMLRDDLTFSADTRAQLEVICRNAELEARLIDDLLDVTRISRGKVVLYRRPVDVCMVVARAAEVCRADVALRKLEFGIGIETGPHMVDADPARLQQVFWNLLNNAIKFTPEGGCVHITCRSDGKGHIVVEVRDSGKGIEAKLLPRLFNAFEQGDRHITRQFGGLGLGLTISKTLVDLHGGTLTASSRGINQGATFTVTLPALPSEVAASIDVAESEVALPVVPPRRLHILLVEDHDDTAAVMIRLLLAHGHTVERAGSVEVALRLAQEHTFDLLLSDIGLPDGSGLDLMTSVRAKGSNLPGIALSGFGQDGDVQASRRAGFMAHLTKPVSLHRLEEAIAMVMRDGASGAR